MKGKAASLLPRSAPGAAGSGPRFAIGVAGGKRRRTCPGVLLIEQGAFGSPGMVATALREGGWPTEVVRAGDGDRIPRSVGAHHGLVLIGGPRGGVREMEPRLVRNEQRLLEGALSLGVPVLALGTATEVLAVTLGAVVTSGLRREVGWHPVHFTPAASEDPLWSGQCDDVTAFHWHGGFFEPPPGTLALAWSARSNCQVFRYGAGTYGILFHPVLDRRRVETLTRRFRDDVFQDRQRPADLLDDSMEPLHRSLGVGREACRRWSRGIGPADARHALDPMGHRSSLLPSRCLTPSQTIHTDRN